MFNLNHYITRVPGETSCYKGIPIQYRRLVSLILRAHGYKSSEFRFCFRGGKRKVGQNSTLLANAVTFAVYRRY